MKISKDLVSHVLVAAFSAVAFGGLGFAIGNITGWRSGFSAGVVPTAPTGASAQSTQNQTFIDLYVKNQLPSEADFWRSPDNYDWVMINYGLVPGLGPTDDAVEAENPVKLKTILDYAYEMDSSDFAYAFDIAAKHTFKNTQAGKEIFKMLLQQRFTPYSETIDTLLDSGNSDALNTVFQKNDDLSLPDDALSHALGSDKFANLATQEDIMQTLIARGAKADSDAVYAAASSNNSKELWAIIKPALQSFPGDDASDVMDVAAQLAISDGNAKAVGFLLDNGLKFGADLEQTFVTMARKQGQNAIADIIEQKYKAGPTAPSPAPAP